MSSAELREKSEEFFAAHPECVVPIEQKVCLTIQEASEYSGIGPTTIRGLLKQPDCPFVLKIGTRSLVKRVRFVEFLNDLATTSITPVK